MKLLFYDYLIFLSVFAFPQLSERKALKTYFQEEPMAQAGTWKDTEGKIIHAHKGTVNYYRGTYYWYGSNATTDSSGNLTCYSSKNMKVWKSEKINVYATDPKIPVSIFVEHPKVIYNQRTKQFVMWSGFWTGDSEIPKVGVAVSDSPTGPFHLLATPQTKSYDAENLALFKDNDGRAYLIHIPDHSNSIYINQLSDDYLTIKAQHISVINGQSNHSPIMFRHENLYYLITSTVVNRNPGTTSYATATSPLGDWKQKGNACIGPFSETTFSSQGNSVIPIEEKKGKYLFMADRWDNNSPENSRYLWLPLEVKADKLSITWSANVP